MADADPALVNQAPLRGLGPSGFDRGEVEVDMAARDIRRDADFLAVAPKHLVRANKDLIEEARERLNDALARVEA